MRLHFTAREILSGNIATARLISAKLVHTPKIFCIRYFRFVLKEFEIVQSVGLKNVPL